MLKIFKIYILLSFIFLLIACQTIPNTNEGKKKITAAQINARLGMAYFERHDLQRAKQKFLLALDEAPTIPETWYSMAYFLENTGNKAKAKEYYLKAVQLSPGRGDVLNNYGTFLCRTGEYHNAINQFVKATQDPAYLGQAAAYENAGLCALKIPNKNKAGQFFERALSEDPNRSVSLIELAELNFKDHQYKQARTKLNAFLKISQPTMQSFLLEKKIDAKLLV